MTPTRFLAAAAAAAAVAVAAGCGGGGDSAYTVAAQIGASSCTDTGYEIVSRVDGHHSRIYDCTTDTAGQICVTTEGGVAQDATALVRIAFADSLTGKPSCDT